MSTQLSSGELVLHSLVQQFLNISQQKVEKALEIKEDEDKNSSNIVRTMRIEEDLTFKQLMVALCNAAEHSLPSLIKVMLEWYRLQHSSGTKYSGQLQLSKIGVSSDNQSYKKNNRELTQSQLEMLSERRDLAIDVLYCQVLISILKQLPLHPGHEEPVNYILNQSFRHFKYKDDVNSSSNKLNVHEVASMYAKVVGVIAQSRFYLVERKFLHYLNDLREKEPSPQVTHSIISLVLGMQSFRVNDFVRCFDFLQELARYFLTVREREIKHALARFFVEILFPVASAAKYEINIPSIKNFVEMLYQPCLEMTTKKKHVLNLLQMTTCLLCVANKTFFMSQLPGLMSICFTQLKNRDPKIARVSLESLYCLLWVYIVRFKCEKHSDTQQKLHNVTNALFPKGSKVLTQKDTDSKFFVEFIKIIAQEKLDFAIKEIIFELIGVNRLQKFTFMPERMNIGLTAFLNLASQTPQKGSEDSYAGSFSGYTQHHLLGTGSPYGRILGHSHQKRILGHAANQNDHLLPETLQPYVNQVNRAFEMILRTLDQQVCRPMMLTVTRDEDADRSQKINLLKTCIAYISRILPESMYKPDLIEFFSRMTLHVDEEIRLMSQQAMISLISNLSSFRIKTIQGYINFVYKNVGEQPILDGCLKFMHQMLQQWRITLQRELLQHSSGSTNFQAERLVLAEAEAFALVMLCQCRFAARRHAFYQLREIRSIYNLFTIFVHNTKNVGSGNSESNICVLDLLDKAMPTVLDKLLPILPPQERNMLNVGYNGPVADFSLLIERSSDIWFGGPRNQAAGPRFVQGVFQRAANSQNESDKRPIQSTSQPQTPYILQPYFDHTRSSDVWGTVLGVIFSPEFLSKAFPLVISHAWGICFHRISQVFPLIDPITLVAENRASSILRGVPKRPQTDRDSLMPVWHNYVVMACCIAPSSSNRRVTRSLETCIYKPNPNFQGLNATDLLAQESSDDDDIQTGMKHFKSGPNSAFKQIKISVNSKSNDTSVDDNIYTSPYSHKKDIRDLMKILVPLLKCEQADFRETLIAGLGRINPAIIKEVLEELGPSLRLATDRKQESARRRKRRDMIRVTLMRIFAIMASNRVFSYNEFIILNECTILQEFIEGMRVYLESMLDHTTPLFNDNKSGFGVSNGTSFGSGSIGSVQSANVIQGCINSSSTIINSNLSGDQGSVIRRNIENISVTHSGSVNHNGGLLLESSPTSSLLNLGNIGSSTNNLMHTSINSLVSSNTSGPSNSMQIQASSTVDLHLLSLTRLHFCAFIRDLIRNLDKENRTHIFLYNNTLQCLFGLLGRWSGHFECLISSTCGEPSSMNFSYQPSMDMIVRNNGCLTQMFQDLFLRNPDYASVDALVNGRPVMTPGSLGHATLSPIDDSENVGVDSSIQSVRLLQDISLWTELVWNANQAMALLLCTKQMDSNDIEYATNTQKSQIVPSALTLQPGYALRWLERLFNARDPILEESPWLWQVPVVHIGILTHSVLGSRIFPPTSSFQKFPYTTHSTDESFKNNSFSMNVIAAAGPHRLDSLFRQLGEETIALLLDVNDKNKSLINWLIDRCYVSSASGTIEVCFETICKLFTHYPKYPLVDELRLVVLSLVYAQSEFEHLTHRARNLFQILYHRFILIPLINNSNSPGSKEDLPNKLYLLSCQTFWISVGHLNPFELHRQFAAQHPEYTVSVFSEICLRLETCRPSLRARLLAFIEPFLINIEMTDLIIAGTKCIQISSSSRRNQPDDKIGAKLLTNLQTNTIHSPEQRTSSPKLRRSEISHNLKQADDSISEDELNIIADHSNSLQNKQQSSISSPQPKHTRNEIKTSIIPNARLRIRRNNVSQDLFGSSDINPPIRSQNNRASLPPLTRHNHNIQSTGLSNVQNSRRYCSAEDCTKTNAIEDPHIDNFGCLDSIVSQSQSVADLNLNRITDARNFNPDDFEDAEIARELDQAQETSPQQQMDLGSPISTPFVKSTSHRYSHRNRSSAPAAYYRSSRSLDPYARQLQEMEIWSKIPIALRVDGTGSKEATQLVLNNLFYFTLRFSSLVDQESNVAESIASLWAVLIRHRPGNTRVILRYLIVVLSLAPTTLLSHVSFHSHNSIFLQAKRVIVFLCREKCETVFEDLIAELRTIDTIGLSVEAIPEFPYFQVSCNNPTSVAMASGLAANKMTCTPAEKGNSLINRGSPSLSERQTSSTIPVARVIQPRTKSYHEPSAQRSHTLEPANQKPRNIHKIFNNSSLISPPTGANRHQLEDIQASEISSPEEETPLSEEMRIRREKCATIYPNTFKQISNEITKNRRSMVLTQSSVMETNHSLRNMGDNQSSGICTGLSAISHLKVRPKSVVIEFTGGRNNGDSFLGSPTNASTNLNYNTKYSPEDVPENFNIYDDRYATLRADEARQYVTSILQHQANSERPRGGTPASDQTAPEVPFSQSSRTRIPSGNADTTQQLVSSRNKQKSRTLPFVPNLSKRNMLGPEDTSDENEAQPVVRLRLTGKNQKSQYFNNTSSLPPNLMTLPQLPLPVLDHSSLYRVSMPNLRRTSDHTTGSQNSPHVLESNDKKSPNKKFEDSPSSRVVVLEQSRLPMPQNGGYHAPLKKWLSEPFIASGMIPIYSAAWSPSNTLSPLVLMLIGELCEHHEFFLDWNTHMPLILLCCLWGMDHSRPLVQDCCKSMLVSILRLSSPYLGNELRQLLAQLRFSSRALSQSYALPGMRKQSYTLTDNGLIFMDTYPLYLHKQLASYRGYLPVEENSSYNFKPFNYVQSSIHSLLSHPMIQQLQLAATSMNYSTPGTESSINPLNLLHFGSQASIQSTTTLISPPVLSSTQPLLPKSNELRFPSIDGTEVPQGLKMQYKAIENLISFFIARNGQPLWQWEDLQVTRFLNSSVNVILNSYYETFETSSFKGSFKPRKLPTLNSLSLDHDFTHEAAGGISLGFPNYNLYTTTSSIPSLSCMEGINNYLSLIRSAQYIDQLIRLMSCILCHPGDVTHSCACYINTNNSSSAIGESVQQTRDCIIGRLANIALDMGLSSHNRHYASRSLQIFRSLGVHLDSKKFTDIISVLADVVADPYDDNICYVGEILLTLEAALNHLQHLTGSIPEYRLISTNATSAFFCSGSQSANMGGSPQVSGNSAASIGCNSAQSSPHKAVISTAGTCSSSASPVVIVPSPRPIDRRYNRRSSSSSLGGDEPCLTILGSGPPGAGVVRRLLPPPNEIAEADLGNVSPVESIRSGGSGQQAFQSPLASMPGKKTSEFSQVKQLEESPLSLDSQADLICGIFWVSVFLLESDFEHEYIAGLRLLNRILPVFHSFPMTTVSTSKNQNTSSKTNSFSSLKACIVERLEKTLSQINWDHKFPGVLNLVLRGLSNANLIDPMYRILVRVIPAIPSSNIIFLGSTHPKNLEKTASVFSTIVVVLMPLLLLAWHEDSLPLSETCRCSEFPMCSHSTQQFNPTLASQFCQIGNWTHSSHYSGLNSSNDSWVSNQNAPYANQSPALQMLCGVNNLGAYPGGQTEKMSTNDNETNLPICAFTVNISGGQGVNIGLYSHNPYAHHSGASSTSTNRNIFNPRNPLCIQAADSLADLMSTWFGIDTHLEVQGLQSSISSTAHSRFGNLTTMFRMYSSSAFSKDSIQWTKCIMKYLYDGCGPGVIANIINNLDALIFFGPSCLHIPSLHLAYWLLHACSDLAHIEIQNEISHFLKTIQDRFVNTPMWSEVVVLMHLLISRSATVSSVPLNITTTLPGLDPDGSGRILDMSAAQAACAVPLPESETPRVELAGKVLEFRFNMLEGAPLLAPDFAPSPLGSLRNPTVTGHFLPSSAISTMLSRNNEQKDSQYNKQTFLLNRHSDSWIILMVNATTGFKKPLACQTKIRDRFSSLLKCFGSTVISSGGNLRSPSVIFSSQSTDTLDPHHHLSIHSSSETTSMNDISNPELRSVDEQLSVDQGTAHFSGYPIEPRLRNLDIINSRCNQEESGWGLRGMSITNHDNFVETNVLTPNGPETSNAQFLKQNFEEYEIKADYRTQIKHLQPNDNSFELKDSQMFSVSTPDLANLSANKIYSKRQVSQNIRSSIRNQMPPRPIRSRSVQALNGVFSLKKSESKKSIPNFKSSKKILVENKYNITPCDAWRSGDEDDESISSGSSSENSNFPPTYQPPDTSSITDRCSQAFYSDSSQSAKDPHSNQNRDSRQRSLCSDNDSISLQQEKAVQELEHVLGDLDDMSSYLADGIEDPIPFRWRSSSGPKTQQPGFEFTDDEEDIQQLKTRNSSMRFQSLSPDDENSSQEISSSTMPPTEDSQYSHSMRHSKSSQEIIIQAVDIDDHSDSLIRNRNSVKFLPPSNPNSRHRSSSHSNKHRLSEESMKNRSSGLSSSLSSLGESEESRYKISLATNPRQSSCHNQKASIPSNLVQRHARCRHGESCSPTRGELLQHRITTASDTNLSQLGFRSSSHKSAPGSSEILSSHGNRPTSLFPSASTIALPLNVSGSHPSTLQSESKTNKLYKLDQSNVIHQKPINHFAHMSEIETSWLRELELGWISAADLTIARADEFENDEKRYFHRLQSVLSFPASFASLMRRSCVMAVHDTQVSFEAATPGSDLDTSAHLRQLCDIAHLMRAQLQIPLLLISSESLMKTQEKETDEVFCTRRFELVHKAFLDCQRELERIERIIDATLDSKNSDPVYFNKRSGLCQTLLQLLSFVLILYQCVCSAQKSVYARLNQCYGHLDWSVQLTKIRDRRIQLKPADQTVSTETLIVLPAQWESRMIQLLNDDSNFSLGYEIYHLARLQGFFTPSHENPHSSNWNEAVEVRELLTNYSYFCWSGNTLPKQSGFAYLLMPIPLIRYSPEDQALKENGIHSRNNSGSPMTTILLLQPSQLKEQFEAKLHEVLKYSPSTL